MTKTTEKYLNYKCGKCGTFINYQSWKTKCPKKNCGGFSFIPLTLKEKNNLSLIKDAMSKLYLTETFLKQLGEHLKEIEKR